ncbi:hypothetical protein NLO88_14255 [Pseudomonas syringae]|nr:hypothetical protein [Pseudomonas syringae]
MKWLDFDPHVTFLRLKVVTYVISGIVAGSAIIALTIIFFTPGLTPNFSSDGWNNALVIFKVPLGLLAVLIPLIALFAANHRSVQSKAQMVLTQSQIELTQDNNLITNYYKHVDEFQKYVEAHVNKLPHLDGASARVAHPRKLHKMLFPRAKAGILKVDEEFLKMLCLDIEKIISATEVFRSERYEGRATHLNILNQKIERFAHKYCIADIRSIGIASFSERDGRIVGDATIRDFIMPFGRTCVAIIQSLSFDESLEMPPRIDQLSRFNWLSLEPERVNNSINYDFNHRVIDDTMIMIGDEEF